MPTREALTHKIRDEKRNRGLTWKAIADAIGSGSTILYKAEAAMLTEPPDRGSLAAVPPSDPLIYRFYELVQTYGTTWKALIVEEFGDGIMSAIDFDMQIEREPNPKGDRVKITMSGKFLPYKRY